MPQAFYEIASTAAKNIQIPRMRIVPEILLDLEGQGVHAPPHVGHPGRQPDTNTPFSAARISGIVRLGSGGGSHWPSHTLLVAGTESIAAIWPIRNILSDLSLRSTASGCCSSKLNGRYIYRSGRSCRFDSGTVWVLFHFQSKRIVVGFLRRYRSHFRKRPVPG